jgi:hypothetical protein
LVRDPIVIADEDQYGALGERDSEGLRCFFAEIEQCRSMINVTRTGTYDPYGVVVTAENGQAQCLVRCPEGATGLLCVGESTYVRINYGDQGDMQVFQGEHLEHLLAKFLAVALWPIGFAELLARPIEGLRAYPKTNRLQFKRSTPAHMNSQGHISGASSELYQLLARTGLDTLVAQQLKRILGLPM